MVEKSAFMIDRPSATIVPLPMISKEGEPSRPTPSRISPSSGIIVFVASRQLRPVRPPAG